MTGESRQPTPPAAPDESAPRPPAWKRFLGAGIMPRVAVILLGVIVYFARKPIIAFFADRREQISSDLDEAAEVLEKAEGRFAEWQRKLIELDREMEQIRSDGRDRAQAEYEGIIADARAVAERIKRDAEAAVDQELRRARNELRDEAALLATELAEKLMREQIGDPDRERLLDEFITRIESGESAAQ